MTLPPATGTAGSAVARLDERRVLEPGAVELVLLELLGDAPPRQSAVLGAAGDVAAVAGQQADEVVALDPADQVVGQVGQGALDVDQRGRRRRRAGRRGGGS